MCFLTANPSTWFGCPLKIERGRKMYKIMFHNAPNLWLTIDFSSRIHLDLAIISLVLYLPNIPTIYNGGCTPKQLATPKKHKISAKCPLNTFFFQKLHLHPNHPRTQKSHITKGPLVFFHPPTLLCRAPPSKLRQPVDRHLYPIPQPQTSEYEGLGWNTDGLFGGILSWWFMSNNPHKSLGL